MHARNLLSYTFKDSTYDESKQATFLTNEICKQC